MNATTRNTANRRQAPGATNEFHQVRVQEKQFDFTPASKARAPQPTAEANASSFFVSSLQASAAEKLAKNFAKMPEIDLLRDEDPELYRMIIARLPVDESELPLTSSVPRITDEGYWKRCCEARWSSGQLSKLSKERLLGKQYGWKRLYLENVLSDFLMSLRCSVSTLPAKAPLQQAAASALHHAEQPPGKVTEFKVDTNIALVDNNVEPLTFVISDDVAKKLETLCSICRDYVQNVDLPCQYTHLNLYEHLFSKSPGIRKFRLTYNVSNAGIGYDKGMVGFTESDAQSVRFLLRKHPTLDTLRLPSNNLTDEYTKAICAGMVDNCTLRVLDLSHNALSDSAADSLSVLLSLPDCGLEELYLDDNCIGDAGTSALAEALEINKGLRILSLNENKIPDADGVCSLIRLLPKMPTLTELGLAHNRLGPQAVEALARSLPALSKLTSLNLAGNRLLGGPTKPLEKPRKPVSPTKVVEKREADEETPQQQPSADGESPEPSAMDRPPSSQAETAVVEPDEAKHMDEEEEEEVVVKSQNGDKLIKAITKNTSLMALDVRECNLSNSEERTIAQLIRKRGHDLRFQQLRQREAANRADIQRAVEDKVTRTHGM